jgi:Na+-transporting NADH:ubiquinone oxidoreductase subunit F
MPTVRFAADDKTVQANDGDWLYDVCQEAGASIPFQCKAGACGTCATELLTGAIKPTQRELRTLEAHAFDPTRVRLPCLHSADADLTFGRSLNLVAAAKPTLAVGEAEVESARRLNLTVAEVRFFVKTPGFAFQPGQYVIFQIPGTGDEVVRRSYSISTAPADERHFEICVRAVAGGYGSNWVHRLRPGTKVKFEGPIGDFTLRDTDRDILMVATGTGLSPIKSMLLHLLEQRSHRRVRLFFGVRSVEDIFYTDLFRGLEAHYRLFQHEIALSSPDPQRWAGTRGRVTELVREQVLAADASHTEAYLCGSQSMIADVESLLLEKGFAGEHIHHENFY